jgi:predicted transglutaminase-like protease
MADCTKNAVNCKIMYNSTQKNNIPVISCDEFFIYLRFEVFTVVTMKNAVFWDVSHVALESSAIQVP